MTKRIRRKYDREFKIEAVKLVTERGTSIAEAARNLGIHENLLRTWKNKYLEDTADSFPGKGNCYDNAVVESFFHTLKIELIYFENYITREDAKNSVFEYIEIYYNRDRIHSTLNYCSPGQFEQIWINTKAA